MGSLPAETPYSLLFRFFYFTQSDPVLGPSIRSLAAYVLGQCLRPPKKNPPARCAALSQLMKVQRVVSADTPPRDLYDKDDGDDAMIWMFIRSAACVRGALQSILNAWLNTGYGSRFAAEEEGGIELCQFLAKHVLNAYNG